MQAFARLVLFCLGSLLALCAIGLALQAIQGGLHQNSSICLGAGCNNRAKSAHQNHNGVRVTV